MVLHRPVETARIIGKFKVEVAQNAFSRKSRFALPSLSIRLDAGELS
jgi:hypothetical protein